MRGIAIGILMAMALAVMAGCSSGDVTESGQLDKQKEIAEATKKGGGDPALTRD